MVRRLACIDVTDKEAIENPSKQQQAALDVLPKLKAFCTENSLSVYDMDDLMIMLRDSQMSTPL